MRCGGEGARLEGSGPPSAATRHGARGAAGRAARDAAPRAAPLAAALAARLERTSLEGPRLLLTSRLAVSPGAAPLLARLLARPTTRTADGQSALARRPRLDGRAAPGGARARRGAEGAAARSSHGQHRARHDGRYHDRLQRLHVWRCRLNIGRRSLQPAARPRPSLSAHLAPCALLAPCRPSAPPPSCLATWCPRRAAIAPRHLSCGRRRCRESRASGARRGAACCVAGGAAAAGRPPLSAHHLGRRLAAERPRGGTDCGPVVSGRRASARRTTESRDATRHRPQRSAVSLPQPARQRAAWRPPHTVTRPGA